MVLAFDYPLCNCLVVRTTWLSLILIGLFLNGSQAIIDRLVYGGLCWTEVSLNSSQEHIYIAAVRSIFWCIRLVSVFEGKACRFGTFQRLFWWL